MRKNSIAFIIAVLAFIVALISPLVISQLTKKTTYSMTTIVVGVSRPTDTVTVRDYNGNLWQFKGAEDWIVNDVCSCVMDNKSTEQVKDDEIISVHYDGYFAGWVE